LSGKSIARSSRGRLEKRVLVERGSYAIVKYIDLKTGEEIEGKRKIYLSSGERRWGLLLIKLREGDKYLAIPDHEVDKELYVYNEDTEGEERVFND